MYLGGASYPPINESDSLKAWLLELEEKKPGDSCSRESHQHNQ